MRTLSISVLALLMIFSGSTVWAIDTNEESSSPNVTYATHIENSGWQNAVTDGAISGTVGESLRLEAITIESSIEGVDINYETHIQNLGWESEYGTSIISNGDVSGTEGEGLRLEAIMINLSGENADQYDVYYEVHAQNFGWLGWAKNGQPAGTSAFGYRLEGIRILILPSGSDAPGDTENAYVRREFTDMEEAQTYLKQMTNSSYEEYTYQGYDSSKGYEFVCQSTGSQPHSFVVSPKGSVYDPLGKYYRVKIVGDETLPYVCSSDEASIYLAEFLSSYSDGTYEEFTYQGYDESKGYSFLGIITGAQERPYYVSPAGSIYDGFKNEYIVAIVGDETLPAIVDSTEAVQYLSDFFNDSTYESFSYQSYDESNGYVILAKNADEEHLYYVSPIGSIFDITHNRFVYYIATGQTVSLETDQDRIEYLNAYLKSCYEYVPGITTKCIGWESESGRVIYGSQERNGVLHDAYEYVVYNNGNIKLNYAPVG
ncbi:hypothetical protein Q5O24_09505 [Eubacteriaceae bacterium ES3]|nr:hypothetical protein Q5O24_09505 [Eubacteriaceae bacterium ES3]